LLSSTTESAFGPLDRRKANSLAPARCQNGAVRQAAVLVLFGAASGDPSPPPGALSDADPATAVVLLIQRSLALRSAAGQIAFPGGMLDDGEDVVSAALREAHEETDIDPTGVTVLHTLTPQLMGYGGTTVTPVLAWWATPSPVRARDPQETAEVFVVPVAELLDPAQRWTSIYGGLAGRAGFRGPAWLLPLAGNERLIWGFTARVLNDLFDGLGWTIPWNTGREVMLNAAGTAPAHPRRG